jgi:hypothetical protein
LEDKNHEPRDSCALKGNGIMGLNALNLKIHPPSSITSGETEYGFAVTDAGPRLAVRAPAESPFWKSYEGEITEQSGQSLLIGPLNPRNAAALRSQLSWLSPCTLGLRTSAGLGDRLGLATPGHVRAIRAAGGKIKPVFAQQSIREMSRTGRTPQQVMDDATWGMFQEGWRDGAGADADHLKTTADIDACLNAGFTIFTVDPGEHVDPRAENADWAELNRLADTLPEVYRPRTSGLLGKTFDIEGRTLFFDEPALLKAAVKYGRAVAHVNMLYRHLDQAAGGRPYELEVSVDETELPTTPLEHLYIVCELRRMGIHWVSLAPRYTGRFEKGVDYIGDVTAFETDLAVHAAIARRLGPYKLSLHSGSDKFSIYPAAARQTRGLVHLKTAGTSYLEALRTVAALDPDLFRAIYAFARDHYETDRASYHVSARTSHAPNPDSAAALPGLLDQFDAREILHVTFGSVLTARTSAGGWLFHDRLMETLRSHPEAYAANLETHFLRHLKPFLGEGVA